MIELKNNILSIDSESIIESNDNILFMSSDVHCPMLGKVTLANGNIKVFPFVRSLDGLYRCRVHFTEEDVPGMSFISFRVEMISDTGTKQTNSIELKINSGLVKQTIAKSASSSIEDIYAKLADMTKKLNDVVSKNSIITEVDVVNPEDIRPGMVPVAFGNEGKFMAQYPFFDVITEINGLTAVNGVVNVDASVIEYNKEKSVKAMLDLMVAAIAALNDSISAITENQKTIASKLDKLMIDFEAHKNTGIV